MAFRLVCKVSIKVVILYTMYTQANVAIRDNKIMDISKSVRPLRAALLLNSSSPRPEGHSKIKLKLHLPRPPGVPRAADGGR